MRMRRFIPYLGIAAGLIFYLFAVAVVNEASQLTPPATGVGTEPITISPVPAVSSPPPADESLAEKKQDESIQPQPKVPPTAAPISAPVSAPAEPQSSPAVDNAKLDAAAAALRAAIVNIICYAPAGSPIHSISGSGVFIEPKGIILTNAHIAQYFLLADRNVTCTIRAGDPAVDRYKAALVYISPAWLNANPSVLTQTNPSGTGEYDFALLAVSRSVNTTPLPSAFPSIPLAVSPPPTKTPVVIATYGAQFLESSQIQSSLFPTVVFGSVKDVFTFATNTIDVLALGGSAAAQEGSSGGGVANSDGRLVGVITTSTTKGTTDTRALDAITASYIRAAYASETGRALDLLLNQPTAASIADFAQKIPELEAIITANLP
ncbi:trypsin-like peptidase domain-containing protein [Candidatus Kaiserbacteria bacterium]|nr:trypsin-like peptidase domain-containing protein [Candidatus Kaiserbacteria bacterium]